MKTAPRTHIWLRQCVNLDRVWSTRPRDDHARPQPHGRPRQCAQALMWTLANLLCSFISPSQSHLLESRDCFVSSSTQSRFFAVYAKLYTHSFSNSVCNVFCTCFCSFLIVSWLWLFIRIPVVNMSLFSITWVCTTTSKICGLTFGTPRISEDMRQKRI